MCAQRPTITFRLRIAGRVFEIETEFPSVPPKYDPFFAEEDAAPDYRIYISQEDILRQKAHEVPANKVTAARDFITTGITWPFSFLIQDRIARCLLREDVLYMHSSSLRCRGRGYVFSAQSGTGKSTHTRLWCEEFGDEVDMINDDKNFIAVGKDGCTVYGTPWRGKHNIGGNIAAPLAGLCFLRQGPRNKIRRLSPTEALFFLRHQVYDWGEEEDSRRIRALSARLAETIPVYLFFCTKDADAARMAREAMEGGAV